MPREEVFKASAVKLNYLHDRPSMAQPWVMLHGGRLAFARISFFGPKLGRRWHTYDALVARLPLLAQ